MNMMKVFSVFMILLGFALTLGILMGLLFQVPYGNIAVIKVDGVITTTGGSLFTQTVSSIELVNKIESVKVNPLIEVVIFDINSGGGSSVGSAAVVRAIKELGKPSVALIRDIGASGAYWIASATDHVVAHNLSLVGSLGVNMDYLDLSGLLDRYNVSYVNLSYPEHKDMLSDYRSLSDTERAWVQEWLEYAYNLLVTDVAANRNMTKEELLPYANGSIFMGYQGMNYGLIDEMGSWPEVLNKSIELTNITDPIVLQYEDTYTLFDLVKGITGKQEASIKT